MLQERQFERIGNTKPIQLDVRFIAATNKNLQAGIREGSFRQDLYYRLNVVSTSLPSLRERRDDIPLLAIYFAKRFSEKLKRRIKGISHRARQSLLQYDWPGNVRELENTIERAVALGSTDVILQEDLPENILEMDAIEYVSVTNYHKALRERKKELVLRALEQTNGNYNQAAKLLDVHVTYLYRLLRNLNINKST